MKTYYKQAAGEDDMKREEVRFDLCVMGMLVIVLLTLLAPRCSAAREAFDRAMKSERVKLCAEAPDICFTDRRLAR